MHLLIDEALRHRLYWLASVELHYLTFEVLVFHLEKLDLALEVEYYLLLGVNLYDWFVFYIHGSCREVEGRDCLLAVKF